MELLMLNEGKTLEFKRDLSSPKNLLKTLVAFANTSGGRAIIGVDDRTKQPIGVEFPLDEEERLSNLIADSIRPRLVPNIEMVTVSDRTLLIVEVYLSNSRPHYLQAEGAERGVYVRLGSSNRQADRELIAEMRRSVEGIAFDEMPIPDLSMSDLDLGVIKKWFGNRRELDEQGLLTLKLLRREQGKLVPTRGAILLFGKDRIFHFPDAWVQCGRFVGNDKAVIFDHIELYEPLPQLVDSMMLFLKKHAMRGADFSGVQRRDVWSIPLGILREAVINALVHADYSQRGAPIRIAFFDDRIEIENPGILLSGMTIEDMKQGISKIRNPVVARVFRELNLIEQWGSGVRRMFREAEELGLPSPEIIEIGLRLRFIVHLAEPVAARNESRLESRLESQLESPLATKVFLHLAQDADNKAGMSRMLGHKTISGELNKQIKRLLSLNLIEMTIPDKPNSRLQKYRLTERGKAWLNAEG
jgi:ATP-dependent DNA helicase RecG